MKLDLAFITGRADPHIDWVLDGLASQLAPDDEVQLIIVDAYPDRTPSAIPAFGGPNAVRELRRQLALGDPPTVIGDRELFILQRPELAKVTVRITPPKPNIWQGPYRITKDNWWGAANARNTALCYARHDYIVFMDDCARLGPKFMTTIRESYISRASVLAGSFVKLRTENDATGVTVQATDHRLEKHPHGKINCGGSWLYGCAVGLPLAWALEVNGFEEGTDSLTGEDYIFGLMLQHRGRRIDFVPDFHVEQERARGAESMKGPFRCMDKGVSPNDKSHAALRRFGSRTRTEFTPSLTVLRAELAAGRLLPVPDPAKDYLDWYDGKPIREFC